MFPRKIKRTLFAFMAAVLLQTVLTAPTGLAAGFPEGPVSLYVGHAPGGANDVMARAIQPYFSKALGVNVVVVNLEGGGGNIAAAQIFRADPDGYTLRFSPYPSDILGQLVKDGDFDVSKFTFLYNVVGGDYNAIFVPVDSPYKTLGDLVEAAKKERLTIAGSGIGTNAHMGLALFEKITGLEFEYVSYNSGSEAAISVAGNHTDCGVGSLLSMKPLQDAGKVRGLVVFGKERHASFPDIPAATEVGYPDAVYDVCAGVTGPPNMPADVVKALSDALAEATSDPRFIATAETLGSNVQPAGPEEFRANVMRIFEQVNSVKDQMREGQN